MSNDTSVVLRRLHLAHFLRDLALERFLLPIADCRRLFEVLPLFPFAYDSFFLNHALEALDGSFKIFTVVKLDISDRPHPLSSC